MDIGAQLKEKRGLLMELKTLLDFLVDVFTEKDCYKEYAIASSARLFPCEKLQDILEAIDRIDRYAVQGRQAFEQNELIQPVWL